MGLREVAEQDLAVLLEDRVGGFGWDITVIDPDGLSAPLVGSSSDIGQLIDPETGQGVSGRFASVVLRISSLVLAGFSSLPKGIAEIDGKPWIMKFDDINGNPGTFKVSSSAPDRAIGAVSCTVEFYKEAA